MSTTTKKKPRATRNDVADRVSEIGTAALQLLAIEGAKREGEARQNVHGLLLPMPARAHAKPGQGCALVYSPECHPQAPVVQR